MILLTILRNKTSLKTVYSFCFPVGKLAIKAEKYFLRL